MYTWKLPCDRLGILSISSFLPQILPQTSSQTQGNSRVSRMEHQTPSVFPGNFRRKRKVLGTLCFPFCFPENLVEPKAEPRLKKTRGGGRAPRPSDDHRKANKRKNSEERGASSGVRMRTPREGALSGDVVVRVRVVFMSGVHYSSE